ncbi:hypothetical protein BHM03_00043121 [Ensete ventricosum]|nr:hypothetical protein BHM03_00043121 [Ensete ventricosum]
MLVDVANIHMKTYLGDLKGALLDADFALREREGNAKAYFRQGQAYSRMFQTSVKSVATNECSLVILEYSLSTSMSTVSPSPLSFRQQRLFHITTLLYIALKAYIKDRSAYGQLTDFKLSSLKEEFAVETSTKFVECCSNQATIHGPAMRSGGPWHRTVSRQSRRRLSPTPIFSTPLRRLLAVALKIPKSMAVVTSTAPWATRFGALLAAPARLRISLSIGLPGKHRTLPSSLRRTMASASAATPPTSGVGEKVTAPYGSWKSPITADVVAGADKRLGGIAAGGDGRLVWIESRPEEGGYVGSFL